MVRNADSEPIDIEPPTATPPPPLTLHPLLLTHHPRPSSNHSSSLLSPHFHLPPSQPNDFRLVRVCVPQYPSAAAYGARLKDMVLALRKDTGKQVPFAALTMRVFGDRALGAFPAANNPHNFDVINEAFEKLASTLPSVYAVNGQKFITNRYFDDGPREHCLSAAQQHCLGPRLAAMLLVGGCLIQKDLHFTARGQIRVGVEFAVTLLDAEKEKYGVLPHGVNASVRVDAAVLPHPPSRKSDSEIRSILRSG
jgi:hypothetical protein